MYLSIIACISVVPQITNKQVYVAELKCQEPNKPYDTKAIISL